MLMAQISDLHVRPPGLLYQDRVPSNEMLAQAVAHLSALDPAPEIVLVTGDLVDHGEPQEYANLRALLDALALPYFVIPGNHDDRDHFRAAFADHRYLPAAGPMHYCIEHYPVRIVALDTTVPGAHHGDVEDAGIAWLAETLADDPTRPTVIIMHHPPFACGIPYLDRYRYHRPERLANVIERFRNVERVLCGHVHRPMQVLWANTLLCACPSTTSQIALRLRPDARPASFLEPPACLLHYWIPGTGIVTHTSYIGRFEGPYPFA